MTDHDIRKEDQKDLVAHFTSIIDDLNERINEVIKRASDEDECMRVSVDIGFYRMLDWLVEPLKEKSYEKYNSGFPSSGRVMEE